MEPTLITEETFDNGVTLRLYDASRKLAGDRWLVALAARAAVPVGDGLLPDIGPEELPEIRQALGDQVVFEQKRERYFIDETQKAAIFDQMLEVFRSMTRKYVAHPRFPGRFVKKALREYLTRKRLDDMRNNGG